MPALAVFGALGLLVVVRIVFTVLRDLQRGEDEPDGGEVE